MYRYWRYMCHHLKFIMIYWDSLLFTRYSVQGSWILILPKSIIHFYCLRWLLPTIPVASCKWNQWSLVATSDSLQQLGQEGPIHLPSRPHVFLWGKASSILWTSKTDLLILKVLWSGTLIEKMLSVSNGILCIHMELCTYSIILVYNLEKRRKGILNELNSDYNQYEASVVPMLTLRNFKEL